MGVINLSILVEKIKRKLVQSGFVKNTDYATNDTAGVVKTSAAYGTAISAGGAFYGSTRSAVQYASGNNATLICKGTLENIKTGLAASALGAIADSAGTAATGTTWTDLTLTKTASGYEISFTTVTPP